MTHLWNSFLDGSDYYPNTLHEVYNTLQRREPEGAQLPITDNQSELAFVNAGSGQTWQVTCYTCGEQGHIANDCPRRAGQPAEQQGQAGQQQAQGTNLCMQGSEEGSNNNGGFSFSQSGMQHIPAT